MTAIHLNPPVTRRAPANVHPNKPKPAPDCLPDSNVPAVHNGRVLRPKFDASKPL